MREEEVQETKVLPGRLSSHLRVAWHHRRPKITLETGGAGLPREQATLPGTLRHPGWNCVLRGQTPPLLEGSMLGEACRRRKSQQCSPQPPASPASSPLRDWAVRDELSSSPHSFNNILLRHTMNTLREGWQWGVEHNRAH